MDISECRIFTGDLFISKSKGFVTKVENVSNGTKES